MKQERKEAINKIVENLELLLHACVLKNRGNVAGTIVDFIGKQTKIQNMIHKRSEELNLSESEKEEIDKYYSNKLIELFSKYLPR